MRFVRMLIAAVPLALAVSLATETASADVGRAAAAGTAKGTVGGALLGGELVCGIEAIAGVKSPWAYLGGAVGGMAAGGVGGYFVERNASARVSMLMLAGGMTLVIPTFVGVLSATAYRPPVDYLQDSPPADEPLANPPQPDSPATAPAAPPPSSGPTAPAPAPAGPEPAPAAEPDATPPAGAAPAPTSVKPRRRHLASRDVPPLVLTPPALLDVTPGRLALGVPAVELQDTYTRAEVAMYGVKQATEVRIPVLNVLF